MILTYDMIWAYMAKFGKGLSYLKKRVTSSTKK